MEEGGRITTSSPHPCLLSILQTECVLDKWGLGDSIRVTKLCLPHQLNFLKSHYGRSEY
jgi:hypothetical protein